LASVLLSVVIEEVLGSRQTADMEATQQTIDNLQANLKVSGDQLVEKVKVRASSAFLNSALLTTAPCNWLPGFGTWLQSKQALKLELCCMLA
jgi:hypothetical protein